MGEQLIVSENNTNNINPIQQIFYDKGKLYVKQGDAILSTEIGIDNTNQFIITDGLQFKKVEDTTQIPDCLKKQEGGKKTYRKQSNRYNKTKKG